MHRADVGATIMGIPYDMATPEPKPAIVKWVPPRSPPPPPKFTREMRYMYSAKETCILELTALPDAYSEGPYH